jgi:hypothetical protein
MRLNLISIAVFAFVSVACSSSTNPASVEPRAQEHIDPKIFTCSIEEGNLVIEKNSADLDELAIVKPGRSDWIAVIIDSPPPELPAPLSPSQFASLNRLSLSTSQLRGVSLSKSPPKSEEIFTSEGTYEIIATSALESDEPRFSCFVSVGSKR